MLSGSRVRENRFTENRPSEMMMYIAFAFPNSQEINCGHEFLQGCPR